VDRTKAMSVPGADVNVGFGAVVMSGVGFEGFGATTAGALGPEVRPGLWVGPIGGTVGLVR